MEARINYHIRGIFMLDEKPIPPTLNKHLTNTIFNKPNKEAMEQVLYYLLWIKGKNYIKTLPWPITTLKEAAEFRNAATAIINDLNGFVYEKSSNVAKVNSSLLANPGGSMFIFFMYQFCIYMKCCLLKKKGIIILNAPLYIEDKYVDKKMSMFAGVSKSNFSEVNEIISRVDYALNNTSELVVKWKEVIQNGKQHIKDIKSELKSVEHCEATEKEVTELKKNYIDLYNKFEQNKLIAMKSARLADIILKTPETLDANIINSVFNINKEELIGSDRKVNLINLLTVIKNTLNNCMYWCEKLEDEEEIDGKILEAKQLIIDLTDQMQCYKNTLKCQNNIIVNLENENEMLNKKLFTSKSFEYIDSKIQSIYLKMTPVVLNTEFSNKPKLMTSEYNKKSRRSISIACNNKPYTYQTMSYDDIKEIYEATLLNRNEENTQNGIDESSFENSSTSHVSTQDTQIVLSQCNKSLEEFTHVTTINQPILTTNVENINNIDNLINSHQTQIKEAEVKNVSISRKSIENIKQKFIRIKTQAQAMSTIPHSPQSPF